MADGIAAARNGRVGPAPFLVDCELVDEHGQAHMLIDDGQHPHDHLLLLNMTNRAGRDLEWLSDGDARRSKELPHLRLLFRPGVLSKVALDKLKDGGAGRELLGPDASHWNLVRVAEEETVALDLVFIGTDRIWPAGKTLTVGLRGLAATGAASRLTRIAVHFANLWETGAQDATGLFPLTRHCQIYLLHGGRRDLPLRIGFAGTGVIRGDGEPDSLIVVLHNPAEKPFGATTSEGPPRLRLSFEAGATPWALWHGAPHTEPEPPKIVEHENLTPVPDSEPLSWSFKLPKEGIAASKSLCVKIGGLRAFTEGTTNLYVDSYDVPGFSHTRTTLTVTRSGLETRLEKKLEEKFIELTTGLNRKLEAAQKEVLGEVRSVREELSAPIPGLTSRLTRVSDRVDGVAFAAAVNPVRMAPVDGWANQQLPERDNRQSWKKLGVKAIDVSSQFVLNKEGTVLPVFGGSVGDPLPKLPSDVIPKSEIGEYLEGPVFIGPGGVLWFHQEKWQQLTTQPGRGGNEIYYYVGDGWLISQRTGYGRGNQRTPQRLELSGSDVNIVPYPIGHFPAIPDRIGGSLADPIVIDAQKNIDGHNWVWRRGATGEWEKQVPNPGEAIASPLLDVNAFGVIVLQNGAVFRYTAGRWRQLDSAVKIQRIGGTWRNPMVIGVDGELYWLEDAT
jgi:hypothetical protein